MVEKKKGILYTACGRWFPSFDEAVREVQEKNPVRRQQAMEGIVELHLGKYKSLQSSPDVPASMDLTARMPPVYDQASRGTCAANAAIALYEYFTDRKWRFSVQYLYERMKRYEQQERKLAAIEYLKGEDFSDPAMEVYVKEAEAMEKGLREKYRVAERLATEPQPVTKEDVARRLYNMAIEMDSGSNFRMVKEVLVNYGVCTYDKWPYARRQLDELALVTDYNNRYLPPGADEDAKSHRLVEDFHILQSPNNVEEIKRYLSGAGGNRPMPVLVGVWCDEKNSFEVPGCDEIVVKSFECSYETVPKPTRGQDGIVVYRPAIDQKTVSPDLETEKDYPDMKLYVAKYGFGGSHAMVLTGYEDNAAFPGGGFFIVRNSWGADWGDGGYGKISYAYIELFCVMSATIVQKMSNYIGTGYGGVTSCDPVATCLSDIPDDLKIYIRTAEKDFKDSHGVISIPKGKRIIVDEDDLAELDNELNRKKFRDRGYSWRGKVVSSKGDGENGGKKIVSSQEAGRFFSGIESGLKRLPFAFPVVGSIKKVGLFLSHPKVEKVMCVEDYTARLGEKFKIYDVTGGKFRVRVAVVYLSSNENAGETSEKVRELLGEYDSQQRFSRADCRLTVIGATGCIAEQVLAYANHEDIRIVADGYVTGKGWRPHAAEMKDRAWYEWLKRLVPNMPGEWTRALADEWQSIADSINGHVTLGKLTERVDLPLEVLGALLGEFLPDYKVKGDKVIKA